MTDWEQYIGKRVLVKPVGLDGPLKELEVRQVAGDMVELGRSYRDPSRDPDQDDIGFWRGDWYHRDYWKVITVVEKPSGDIIERL
jgi:hypothetical protein